MDPLLDQPVSDELFISPGGGFDVMALVVAVLRRKIFIFLMGVLCAVAAYLYLARVPAIFRASAVILPPQVSRSGSTASLLSQAGVGIDSSSLGGLSSVLQSKSQADMFVIILTAWPIRQALVDRFDLQSVYHVKKAAEARSILLSNTDVKGSREGFITISVIDKDKKRSADLANGYIEESRNFLRGLSLTDASQRRIFYEAQLAKTKDDLAAAEVAFQHMQQNSGMVSLDSQARTLLESAASLRSQITAKEVQLQSLRGYSTESNPQVQITETELEALRGQLSQLESHGQGGLTGKSLSSVPGAELEFVRATRELKYQEGLYDLLVKQYEGSRIDEAREAPIVQTIEPALPPEGKFGPRRIKDTSEAFLFGIFLGFVITVVRFTVSQLDAGTLDKMTQVRRALFYWRA